MKKLIIIFISLISFLEILPQTQSFNLEFDYARFFYDDSSGFFELYYSFYEPGFKSVFEDSVESVNGSLFLKIEDAKSNEVIVNKEYQFKSHPQKKDNGDKNLIGVIAFQIPNGVYNCLMVGKDTQKENSLDSINFKFEINKNIKDRLTLSDIQLASSIRQSDNHNSIFYKNSYEVVPNPSLLFGDRMPMLYFYAEIYNLLEDVHSEVIKIEQNLYNSKNQLVHSKSKYIARKNNNIVEAGAINISKFPTGAYVLSLIISDTLLTTKVISSKRLFIYNPSVPDTLTETVSGNEMLASEFASMSEEEIEESYATAKYIATSNEINQWARLNEIDSKRTFMFNYWKARDEMPYTPQNETKMKYYERVKYANDRFSNIQKKGWKTDRGRVYIMYGEPSEIDRYPNQVDTKPYEVWYYHSIEGGVEFVFADITGFSEYMLLHSTMRGEMRDDNWQRRIQTNK